MLKIAPWLPNFYEIASLRSVARASRQALFANVRRVKSTDRKLVDTYFKQASVKKLHIGCGSNKIAGWLNADYYPRSPTVLHLDATRPFGLLAGETLDYVFSEHMIEHIPYSSGSQMLSECYRVLKRQGKLRVSTPDLLFLVELFRTDKTPLQEQYINWASNRLRWAPYPNDAFVINNFVRDYGHQFIYDEKTLSAAMERTGFTNIKRWALQESDDEALRMLENETRMPAGFLKLETITLEGTK